MAIDGQAEYHAYLLRLWRESPQSPWRVLLVTTDSQKRLLFPHLEALFSFLEEAGISPLPDPDCPTE